MKKNSYLIKLTIQIPFECHVNAKDKDEATDIALDNAMDYLEDQTSGRKFDELWEYKTDCKIVEIKEK